MGALIQACFKAWKASKASSDSGTHSVFSAGSLPGHVFVQWLSNPFEVLYESLVMAYEAEKSTDFCIGSRQCTLSNGH